MFKELFIFFWWEIYEFETDLNNFLCLRSNLSYDNIISA